MIEGWGSKLKIFSCLAESYEEEVVVGEVGIGGWGSRFGRERDS